MDKSGKIWYWVHLHFDIAKNLTIYGHAIPSRQLALWRLRYGFIVLPEKWQLTWKYSFDVHPMRWTIYLIGWPHVNIIIRVVFPYQIIHNASALNPLPHHPNWLSNCFNICIFNCWQICQLSKVLHLWPITNRKNQCPFDSMIL